jgi:hypothetical protein
LAFLFREIRPFGFGLRHFDGGIEPSIQFGGFEKRNGVVALVSGRECDGVWLSRADHLRPA